MKLSELIRKNLNLLNEVYNKGLFNLNSENINEGHTRTPYNMSLHNRLKYAKSYRDKNKEMNINSYVNKEYLA